MHKIVKYFNLTVNKILIKLNNKTNHFFSRESKVSNFNKLVITFISLIFFYLFYLSVPNLYNKTWVQNTLENKLIEDFKINFSTSSDISYYILPSPHFLIKNSKILKENNELNVPISEIKSLKIFINQSNFFDKKKINIKKIIIENANFTFKRDDFNFFNIDNKIKFSTKKIMIKDSNIFFKNSINETIAISKISKGFLFFNNSKLLNLINLNGRVFNIPFIFDYNKEVYSSENKEVNIIAKSLKLNILNRSSKKIKGLIKGVNVLTIMNSKIYSKYNIKDNLIFLNQVIQL